ncbi:MAG: c-type cytochrome [Anaerolineae bacterium]
MIDSRILVGLISILIAISAVVYIGIGDGDRRVEFAQAFKGRSIERGAAIFTEYCTPCHGDHGQGSPRAPTLNSKYFFTQRLKDVGYLGTLPAYVRLTVAGGRPIKTSDQWPQNMPTWSVTYGGPLRNDQVDDVVNYIMNWESTAPDLGNPNAAPTPVPGDTPEERGKNLFTGMGCVACHMINGEGQTVGPDLTQVYSKGEDYIRQSILQPNAVIAEGYQPNLMPQNFGDRLTDEYINDIIAYFKSVSGG